MKVTEEVPRFVERDMPPRVVAFSSVEELLDVDWIKTWAKPFEQFIFCKSGDLLMIQGKLKGGETEFHVIGYLSEPEKVALPEWVR